MQNSLKQTTITESRRSHPVLLLSLFFAINLILFASSLFLGKYPLTPEALFAGEKQSVQVFLTLRLPRTCMGLLGGFSLGIAGMVYQTVFRNPLASPDIIGVASGASAGAAFAILFLPAAPMIITSSAFAGSLVAVLLALGIASLVPGKGSASIVLAGIAVHSLAQTLLMVLKLTADPEKELASIEYWIMGSLNGITLSRLPFVLLVCTFSIFLLLLFHRQLLLLSLADEEAQMLGTPVRVLRLAVLILATLTVAAVISVTGLISFIGLLAPHIARLLTGNCKVHTLVLSGLMGGMLLTAADMLARSVAQSELPVSIFTSLLGAPFLLYLILKREEHL